MAFSSDERPRSVRPPSPAAGALACIALATAIGPSAAHAHPGHGHGSSSGRLPVTLESAGGYDPVSGRTASSRTRVGLSTRYMRLDVPKEDPDLGDVRHHALFNELQASYAPMPSVGFEAGLPLVVRVPRGGGAEGGVGDLRLGAQLVPFIDRERRLVVGAGLETTFPTGDHGKGFSAAEYITRVSGFSSHTLGPDGRWSLIPTVGLSWAWRTGTNVVLDYGATGSYAALERMGLFVAVRAQTFLRTTADRFSAVQRRGRRAGDTALVVTPGVTFTPVDGLFISFGPQIPLSPVRDFDVGAALTVQYTLP